MRLNAINEHFERLMVRRAHGAVDVHVFPMDTRPTIDRNQLAAPAPDTEVKPGETVVLLFQPSLNGLPLSQFQAAASPCPLCADAHEIALCRCGFDIAPTEGDVARLLGGEPVEAASHRLTVIVPCPLCQPQRYCSDPIITDPGGEYL
jgi:hypothetical protein